MIIGEPDRRVKAGARPASYPPDQRRMMSGAHVVVTVLTAAWVGFSAVSTYRRARWVVEPFADYGVPRSWWPWLATAKALGAAGLLAGLALPIIGVIAATGLVLYFAGAVVTVLRARAFSHVPYPLLYLAPSIAALTLGLTA
ncbi:DoxX family protein [Micromonospora purpureochromogenes]|uniref:DoxX-like family protein n=1 Tax=Micromonospora purpureochromogenes TaxID=47872 RepID=A0ABX2RTP1_9ACTN|nr:DoxX family protein [Micromonospora purpureochromogenes]NYF59902.1 hypothetical protein [Micromonospora purpureochromogenes]